VSAPVDLVEVGEVGVAPFDPAARRPEDLVGERGEADRERDLRRSLAARNSGALTFDSEELTVGEYLDRWLESIRDSVKPVSWENYERNIRLHLKPALGNVKLAKLTPGRIQALYDKKRSTMSPASVKLIHAVLHKALKQAQMWRLVRENVAEATVKPKARAEEIRPLDTEQTKALLKAVAGDRHEALHARADHWRTHRRTARLTLDGP
jgi:integrase